MARNVTEETPSPGTADDLTGQTLSGGHVLTERRVHGGARSVYAGRSSDGKPVLVTVFPPEVGRSSDDGRAFAAQVRALKELNHGGIPELLEAGATGDGRRYVVHARVDGRPLRDVLKSEAPLGPERAAQILMKAARVLAHVRSGGAMHGNLKPENIMLVVTPTDLEGVVLQDVGVAKLLQLRPGARAAIAGTPRYMSPEQASGIADACSGLM